VRADCIPGHPELRCQPPASCDKSFADAVLFSFYRDSPEFNFVTPVQWVDVSENGSVLVAWNNHHPGDTTPLVPGVSYGPAMDRGAPVVMVGESVRPKVVGVVSGWLDVPEKGVLYRITRTDTWAPWVVAQIQSWFGPRYPTPDVPPAPGKPPVEHYQGVLRRKGSLTAAGALLVFGGGGILIAAR
jgi:hypothetical protein